MISSVGMIFPFPTESENESHVPVTTNQINIMHMYTIPSIQISIKKQDWQWGCWPLDRRFIMIFACQMVGTVNHVQNKHQSERIGFKTQERLCGWIQEVVVRNSSADYNTKIHCNIKHMDMEGISTVYIQKNRKGWTNNDQQTRMSAVLWPVKQGQKTHTWANYNNSLTWIVWPYLYPKGPHQP